MSFENLIGESLGTDLDKMRETDMVFKKGEHCEASFLIFGPRYFGPSS